MRTRRTHLLIASVIGAALGFGYPLVELFLDCRVPDSEPCVWDRAYLPLSLGVGAIIAIVIAALTYVFLRARSQETDATV